MSPVISLFNASGYLIPPTGLLWRNFMKGKKVLTVVFATTKHIPANEVTVSCEESIFSGPIKRQYTKGPA